MAMTSEAKRALSRTIRELRQRLIDDLGEATERAYRMSIDARKAALDEASRVRRARLEGWIEEQVRAGGKGTTAVRLRADVVKDAAATLLQRIVYLRLLEATGLRSDKIVTGGWDSRGYKDFREAAPELVRVGPGAGPRTGAGSGDDSEGYATLLQLVFEELALDLPGLYGPVRLTALVPVPASTLRALVTALDDDELASVWTDDTTLGWIYQYWNDPEREALDAKLAASKKLENHELASKTQMFTERYMVEWLLHNSLGEMWLAMCRKHGWTADVERDDGGGSVLDRLEARRGAWRARREAGEVALDALMPIEPGLEERWKYWVPQPMPADAVTAAPDSVRALKLLDPACGSGHFLVIACELLFFLYQEEARHRTERGDAAAGAAGGAAGGETWSDREIVESILEHNLHGLDIDPRAVQIAAAALMLKARQLCATAEPRTLNLVAPTLSLAALAETDPTRRALAAAIEHETGVPPALTGQLLAALAGADHLGTLLRVDAEIDRAIEGWEAQLSQPLPDQGTLFEGFGPRRRKRLTGDHARATVLARLEGFLAHHTSGADLGLRLRGEQLAAGVRFVRMVREGQYDLVIGNPPYQGTSKMADKAYVEQHYPRGKADLYAAFLERGLQLARQGGVSALLTMRNWMFIKQFSALREWLLESYDLRMLGDVDRGAFEDVPDEVVAAVMSIFRRAPASESQSIAMQPTPLEDKTRDSERTKRKRAAVLAQVGRWEFLPGSMRSLRLTPILYWWTNGELEIYRSNGLIGDTCPARKGIDTGSNARFVRYWWEVASDVVQCRLHADALPVVWSRDASWVPYLMGGQSRAWIEPLIFVVNWSRAGLGIFVRATHSSGTTIRNPNCFFSPGVAFTPIGAQFTARAHRYQSICDNMGTSVFTAETAQMTCLLNSSRAAEVASALNPSIHFQVGDVNRLPFLIDDRAQDTMNTLETEFQVHEHARETSIEFLRPGPSPWLAAQAWAKATVDRKSPGAYVPSYESLPVASHLSHALGNALGRFGPEGVTRTDSWLSMSLPHGILFLSDASDDDSLAHSAAAPILAAWTEHGAAIDDTRSLKHYLQDRFFPDVHRKMYENRPIYFPLSSGKKSFVAYVSIHRWTATTLNDLLAEHLYPAKKRLEGEQTDLRATRDGADKKAARAAEKRFGDTTKWLEELNDFIATVEQCAEKGPPPDGKTQPRETDARYEPDLDDGVMINAAALWPLLEPQWKDPRKWWRELANAEGKKDYDWAHLARRYFPTRVDAKCKLDPSLAVAHGCFWSYHPAKAYQWELRLQDEIRPDFTIDEPGDEPGDRLGSDAARAAFLADHPDEAEALVVKEHLRRQRKLAKAGAASDDDEPQGELELDADAEGDAEDEASA